MNNTLPHILTILMGMWASIAFSSYNTLTVTITNIKKIEGTIEIGIFQNSNDFPHEGSQMYKLRRPVFKDSLQVEFTDLADGEYAIAIFHDINNDGMCNVNFIGYPKEPYGFSNNRRPFLKAPSFKSTKFRVTKDKEIYIELIR